VTVSLGSTETPLEGPLPTRRVAGNDRFAPLAQFEGYDERWVG
jgi:hypothetical protein